MIYRYFSGLTCQLHETFCMGKPCGSLIGNIFTNWIEHIYDECSPLPFVMQAVFSSNPFLLHSLSLPHTLLYIFVLIYSKRLGPLWRHFFNDIREFLTWLEFLTFNTNCYWGGGASRQTFEQRHILKFKSSFNSGP